MQRFFEALSQGDGPGTRPIELQACDPVRYLAVERLPGSCHLPGGVPPKKNLKAYNPLNR